jgi:hypothetical protein
VKCLVFKGFGCWSSLFDEKSFTYWQNNIGNLGGMVHVPCVASKQGTPQQTKTTMRTKTKTIQCFTTPSGLVFTDKAGFVETLFTPINGKTADGYFTRHKSKKRGTRAIRLFHGNGEIFAVIVSNGRDGQARSASTRNGKVWAMFCLTDHDEKYLGFDLVRYSEQGQVCVDIVDKANPINAAHDCKLTIIPFDA